MKSKTLVLGASTNPNRYSNIAIRRLIDKQIDDGVADRGYRRVIKEIILNKTPRRRLMPSQKTDRTSGLRSDKANTSMELLRPIS